MQAFSKDCNAGQVLYILTDDADIKSEQAISIYHWNSYEIGHGTRSIPIYVEENSDRLRTKYLAFVHDLGETLVDGKPLKQQFALNHGYNLWWMSLLAEKSPFKSPRIVDCLKLLALDELLRVEQFSVVNLISDDRLLAIAIENLCHRLGYRFTWQQSLSKQRNFSFWSLRLHKPHILQGFIFLVRHITARWPLRQIDRSHWFSGSQSIFFLSYFIHLDSSQCASGQFYSKQWEVLPALMKELGAVTNWIHHFLFSPVVPDAQTGLTWVNQFNQDAVNQGRHAFLESYLTWSVILKVCYKFLGLFFKSRRYLYLSEPFRIADSAAWFWPLLKQDWLTSICGTVAIQNLLWIELLDTAMATLPKQNLGFYLQENQGWERAFIHAWKRYDHGQLIGVAHSTIRYWDLRYFDDPRALMPKAENNHQDSSRPRPDAIALNSPIAWQSYIDAKYPPDEILSVEALRYLNLLDLHRDVKDLSVGELYPMHGSPTLKVLLLGDSLFEFNQSMIQCIEESVACLNIGPRKITFVLREHPSCPIAIDDYKTLQIEKTTLSMHEVIQNHELVIVSGSTSAILDVYLAGLYVIGFISRNALNFSPLREIPGVKFVSNPKEMSAAIIDSVTKTASKPQDYFWLDQSLPRWRRLLKEAGFSGSISNSTPVSNVN